MRTQYTAQLTLKRSLRTDLNTSPNAKSATSIKWLLTRTIICTKHERILWIRLPRNAYAELTRATLLETTLAYAGQCFLVDFCKETKIPMECVALTITLAATLLLVFSV